MLGHGETLVTGIDLDGMVCNVFSTVLYHMLIFPHNPWHATMSDRQLKAAKSAFNASIDGGITFIDTAEVYGSGVCTLIL